METINKMQAHAWVPTAGCKRLGSAAEAILVVRRIDAPQDMQQDVVVRLRKSWIGKAYLKYLKRFVFVRAFVLLAFRHGYPLYVNYFSVYLSERKVRRWRSLVRISDFAKRSESQKFKLADSCVVEIPMPQVFPAIDQSNLVFQHDHYVFPEVFVTTVQKAMVYGGTNLVLAGEDVICHDLYDFERDYMSEELHSRIFIDPKSERIRWLLYDEAPETIPVAAAFVDACAKNYAHWMTEVLPRICLFCSDERFREVPIVVNDGMHPNIMESLSLVVDPQREVIILPVGRALSVAQLYLTTPTGYVPFGRRTNKLTGHSQGMFSPDALKALRKRLGASSREYTTRSWPKKIYLRRNTGVRRLVNAEEIERILVSEGYAIVDSEKLTFSQQVSLFSNAEIVIATTGAACVNIVFCKANARGAVMMAKHENMPYRYWSNMAAPVGVKVDYVLGDQVGVSANGIHDNFKINPEDVRSVVRMMESS